MSRWAVYLLVVLCVSVPGFPAHADGEQERDYEIAMTKGIAELQTGNAAEAVGHFREARRAKPKDQHAALSLGIAIAKTGDLEGAKAMLLEAQAIDPADPRTKYELGRVLDRLGEQTTARLLFESVAGSSLADNDLRRAALVFLERTAGPGEAAGFRFASLAGVQFDSNVILEPAMPSPSRKEKKADWSGIVIAEGMYRSALSRASTLEGGYQLYQNLHGKLEDYNIQQHTVKIAARSQASGSPAYGARYAFNYTAVGGSEHYSTSNEVMPYVETTFTPSSTTQFRYLFQRISYYDDPAFPLNRERSGMSHAGGMTHSAKWESVMLSLSYDYAVGTADKEYWNYTEQYGQIGLQMKTGGWTGQLSAAYRDQRYDAAAPGYAEARHDGMQEYAITLSRKLTERMNLSLSGSHIMSDSNLAPFEYTRNIAGLLLGMRL